MQTWRLRSGHRDVCEVCVTIFFHSVLCMQRRLLGQWGHYLREGGMAMVGLGHLPAMILYHAQGCCRWGLGS